MRQRLLPDCTMMVALGALAALGTLGPLGRAACRAVVTGAPAAPLGSGRISDSWSTDRSVSPLALRALMLSECLPGDSALSGTTTHSPRLSAIARPIASLPSTPPISPLGAARPALTAP